MQSFVHDLGIEAGRLRRRLGFTSTSGSVRQSWLRSVLIHLSIIAVFGVFLPFGQGIGFFDSVVLGAYQALAVVFAAPAAAVRFEQPPRFTETIARVLVCCVYGGVLAWILIVTGAATVLLTNAVYVGPSLETLADTGIFGIGLSLAVTSAAVWLTLISSPSAAKVWVRAVFFSLLIVFFFRSRWLPDIAWTGAGIAAAVTILLWFLLWKVAARQNNMVVPNPRD